MRSAQLGKRVAIVEREFWGGVCLNVGCVQSKSLIHSAEIVRTIQVAQSHGISIPGEVRIDYGVAFSRSRTVADGRVKGIHYLMKKNSVTEFEATGVFTGPHSMSLQYSDGRVDEITFDNAIIATGAETRLLPGTAVSNRVRTYREQVLAESLPSSIVIAGAGAIGVEFAYILSSYGVEVTLVEFAERIVPLEDVDVSKELTRRYKKLGITIHTATRVERVREDEESVSVDVVSARGSATLRAECLLQAIGFAPRTAGYGLEQTGVELDDRGAIIVNDQMRTSVPHIAAIGDVTARLMLAHVAEAMALIAAEPLAGFDTHTMEYAAMPRATYSQPQVASFGPTEQQAREQGIELTVTTFPFLANAKAHAVGDPGGFVKLLTSARDSTIVGAHMIGPDVNELLPELTLAHQVGVPIHAAARNVHAHPTLSEAVKESLHGAAGHLINL